jgi:hypothetical protein
VRSKIRRTDRQVADRWPSPFETAQPVRRVTPPAAPPKSIEVRADAWKNSRNARTSRTKLQASSQGRWMHPGDSRRPRPGRTRGPFRPPRCDTARNMTSPEPRAGARRLIGEPPQSNVMPLHDRAVQIVPGRSPGAWLSQTWTVTSRRARASGGDDGRDGGPNTRARSTMKCCLKGTTRSGKQSRRRDWSSMPRIGHHGDADEEKARSSRSGRSSAQSLHANSG